MNSDYRWILVYGDATYVASGAQAARLDASSGGYAYPVESIWDAYRFRSEADAAQYRSICGARWDIKKISITIF